MNKKGGTSLPMEEYVCLTNMQACLVPTPMKGIGVGRRVGIVLFQSSWMEMILKVQIQRKTAKGVENCGSGGKSNNLCDRFCDYFISVCEEQ